MKIEDMIYVEEMRQRLGLDENDTSKDKYLEQMKPFDRVKLIIGWEFGDESWGDTFKEWCDSQGLYLTTNANDKEII